MARPKKEWPAAPDYDGPVIPPNIVPKCIRCRVPGEWRFGTKGFIYGSCAACRVDPLDARRILGRMGVYGHE